MFPIDLKNSRILITNDDGYSADGIKILYEIAKNYTSDVWIVAPEYEKSGASHALTFIKDLTLKKQDENIYSVNGTPSDCVVIALENVLQDKRPDILLSGINSGVNVAEDVTYSGTIAAAMEGVIRRVPSIAISQNYDLGKKNEISWDVSKAFLDKVLDSVSATGWDFNSLLNVNFPQCNVNEVNGIEVTSQGNRETDDLVLWKKENNLFRIGLQRRLGESSKPKNNILNKPIDGVMTDVVALTSNKISITPLHLDLTHAASIEILRKSLKLKQT
jgi:5'-nucleotidase|tara:strand:+ start:837 stop:1661 length:825 start_codon:yes stop_codon:yes gene_type:complete